MTDQQIVFLFIGILLSPILVGLCRLVYCFISSWWEQKESNALNGAPKGEEVSDFKSNYDSTVPTIIPSMEWDFVDSALIENRDTHTNMVEIFERHLDGVAPNREIDHFTIAQGETVCYLFKPSFRLSSLSSLIVMSGGNIKVTFRGRKDRELNTGIKEKEKQTVLDAEGRIVEIRWKDVSGNGNGNDLIQEPTEKGVLFVSKRESELEKEIAELKQRLAEIDTAIDSDGNVIWNSLGSQPRRECRPRWVSSNEMALEARLAWYEKDAPRLAAEAVSKQYDVSLYYDGPNIVPLTYSHD